MRTHVENAKWNGVEINQNIISRQKAKIGQCCEECLAAYKRFDLLQFLCLSHYIAIALARVLQAQQHKKYIMLLQGSSNTILLDSKPLIMKAVRITSHENNFPQFHLCDKCHTIQTMNEICFLFSCWTCKSDLQIASWINSHQWSARRFDEQIWCQCIDKITLFFFFKVKINIFIITIITIE